jgi:hypothetical protein
VKLSPGLPWQKQRSGRRRRRRRRIFHQQIGLKFKEETNVAFGALLCVMLERGHFGK